MVVHVSTGRGNAPVPASDDASIATQAAITTSQIQLSGRRRTQYDGAHW